MTYRTSEIDPLAVDGPPIVPLPERKRVLWPWVKRWRWTLGTVSAAIAYGTFWWLFQAWWLGVLGLVAGVLVWGGMGLMEDRERI